MKKEDVTPGTGRFYGIGVGPGDPELLTLRAARLVGRVPVIFTPEARAGGGSRALKVVEHLLDSGRQEVVFLHFPMAREKDVMEPAWAGAAERIGAVLQSGRDAAFLTIGDPLLYSTFGYILDEMARRFSGLASEVVPGVTSVTAVAAAAGVSLARTDERVMILPAVYRPGEIEEALDRFETVVFMKVNRVFDEVRDVIGRMGILDRAVLVTRCGTAGERIYRDLREVDGADLDYLSTLIVTKSV
ncbi:MAG: precorrin-2 C(20)-methyltransferase [Deltaproteobacteria bacterium]|nr:precorrin-2 C(20)-methyltransferase [Deltaproteobacteria bacterium]